MNLLPGLRDLRTPLAVGYLWLAVLWLVFESSLPHADEATGLIASVYRIGNLLGPAPSLAIVSFVAYVIGATFTPLSLFGNSLQRLVVNNLWLIPGLESRMLYAGYSVTDFVRQQARQIHNDPSMDEEKYNRRLEELATDSEMGEMWKGPDREFRIIAYHVERELSGVVAKLQVFDKEQLYQSYDRSVSEAQFRTGIAMPLLALDIVLAVRGPWWSIIGLLLPVVLLWQAEVKNREATRIAYESIVHGIIPSSTITSLKEAAAP